MYLVSGTRLSGKFKERARDTHARKRSSSITGFAFFFYKYAYGECRLSKQWVPESTQRNKQFNVLLYPSVYFYACCIECSIYLNNCFWLNCLFVCPVNYVTFFLFYSSLCLISIDLVSFKMLKNFRVYNSMIYLLEFFRYELLFSNSYKQTSWIHKRLWNILIDKNQWRFEEDMKICKKE